MGNETIILLVGGFSVVFGLAAWVGLMAAPAWQSYGALWAVVIWFWDSVSA